MRVWTNGEKWYYEPKTREVNACVVDSEGYIICKCTSTLEAKRIVTAHNVAMTSLYDRLEAQAAQHAPVGTWPNWGDSPNGFDGPTAAE